MIENATDWTNATNLIAQSEGTVIENIINWLIAFFSESENVLLSILIITTIWVTKMAHKRSDFYNRFQDVYKDLLTPSTVTLLPDLKYTQQKHPEWEGFISEVNKRVKYHPFRYKMRGLKEKIEKAINDYEKLESFEEIMAIVDNRLKKEGFASMIWKREKKQVRPLGDYIDWTEIPCSIENINRSSPVKIEPSGDGKYRVHCADTSIAKITSWEKSAEFRDLFDSIAKSAEVKRLIRERDKAKGEVNEALKEYNEKLAKVIQDLRFCRW